MTLFVYLFRQIALGVVVAVCGMFFIAIPGITVQAVTKLGGAGLSVLLGYLPLVLVDLIPYLLPIGFLLAVVATYGRLAADAEWTAIRMAGMHPWRSAAPAFVLAIACSALLGWLVHVVSPDTQFKKRDFLRNAIVEGFKNLSPGQTELSIGQFYLNAPYREENTFFDALIHIPSSKAGRDRTVLADTVEIEAHEHEIVIRMTNARTVYGEQDTTIGAPVVRLNLDELLQTDRRARTTWKYQPTTVLHAMIASGKVPQKDLAYALYEIQERWTLMCTPLLFFLLGVPTGLLVRSSTQLGALAIGVVYALAYYILSMRLSREIGVGGGEHEVLVAWAVPVLGCLLGARLAWKAFRE